MPDELSELQRQRLAKLERMRQAGVDPYPARVRRSHSAVEAVQAYEQAEAAAQPGPDVALAGRLLTVRIMGKASFAHILDGSGRIQLYFKLDTLGPENYERFKRDFDLGDFIGASGVLFRTRTGEITLHVHEFAMLAKALNPLPEKWHGLRDVEVRYRQRYLDLVANQEVRRIFITRSRAVSAMRRFLDGRGFLEVETPVLQPIYGGATARPFETYHNVLDRTLYLRISNELYLKRLIVGGLDRVYEIARDFRNEGISTKHNPEFSMMECYQAYADYHDMMELTEYMVAFITQEALGTTRLTYQGHTFDVTPPWPRLTMRDAIRDRTGIDIVEHDTLAGLRVAIRARNLNVDPQPTWGKTVDELMKNYVEPGLVAPIFILDYPIDLSPLAKKRPDNPRFVERFEAFIGGFEIANAFSELNDPLDQQERFLMQVELREAGEEETHPVDDDYVQALMYGMPPTGGLGVGVDRLVMILTDQASIREVILFPQLRSKE
jgi:lysyl-tRNA synthetase class 2